MGRGRILGRRTNRSQRSSNGGLGLKKPFPNAIGCRVTHGGAKLLKRLRFIPGCRGLLQKSPKLFCIEKESFNFIGDPHAESSATAAVAATITTEDAKSPNCFLSEIQLIVSFEESVSIQGFGVFAVRTRQALEQSQLSVPLFLRSENPHRH